MFVRGLLEFVDQHGLARLQGLGNFRVHPESQVRALVIGRGHLARFSLDLVAERGAGFDHARASAIRTRLAEDALKRLLGAFSRDADQAELVERERFRRSFVLL